MSENPSTRDTIIGAVAVAFLCLILAIIGGATYMIMNQDEGYDEDVVTGKSLRPEVLIPKGR